jgi:hypothetical protein
MLGFLQKIHAATQPKLLPVLLRKFPPKNLEMLWTFWAVVGPVVGEVCLACCEHSGARVLGVGLEGTFEIREAVLIPRTIGS